MNTRNLPESAGATAPDGTPARGGRPNQVGLRVYRQPLVTNVSAARWLLLAIVAASIYFFHGFLVPVLAAAVIALASWPIRDRAAFGLGLGRTGAAALLVLVLVCFLLVPIAMALAYAFRELRDWISWAIMVNGMVIRLL